MNCGENERSEETERSGENERMKMANEHMNTGANNTGGYEHCGQIDPGRDEGRENLF